MGICNAFAAAQCRRRRAASRYWQREFCGSAARNQQLHHVDGGTNGGAIYGCAAVLDAMRRSFMAVGAIFCDDVTQLAAAAAGTANLPALLQHDIVSAAGCHVEVAITTSVTNIEVDRVLGLYRREFGLRMGINTGIDGRKQFLVEAAGIVAAAQLASVAYSGRGARPVSALADACV